MEHICVKHLSFTRERRFLVPSHPPRARAQQKARAESSGHFFRIPRAPGHAVLAASGQSMLVDTRVPGESGMPPAPAEALWPRRALPGQRGTLTDQRRTEAGECPPSSIMWHHALPRRPCGQRRRASSRSRFVTLLITGLIAVELQPTAGAFSPINRCARKLMPSPRKPGDKIPSPSLSASVSAAGELIYEAGEGAPGAGARIPCPRCKIEDPGIHAGEL